MQVFPTAAPTTIPEAFDRMRGHGGPSEQDLQRLLRGASQHNGRWPRISIWHGSADRTVAHSNAEAIVGQWRGVHKLGKSPTLTQVADGQSRRVWCDADGTELLEAHTIAGMGHGTPLNTKGNDGLGTPAPFMLDVGISSTRHIANFWGIAAFGNPAASRTEAAPQSPRRELAAASPELASTGVRKIIEDALRSAGLMG